MFRLAKSFSSFLQALVNSIKPKARAHLRCLWIKIALVSSLYILLPYVCQSYTSLSQYKTKTTYNLTRREVISSKLLYYKDYIVPNASKTLFGMASNNLVYFYACTTHARSTFLSLSNVLGVVFTGPSFSRHYSEKLEPLKVLSKKT